MITESVISIKTNKISLRAMIFDILKNRASQPLSAKEIADLLFIFYPEYKARKEEMARSNSSKTSAIKQAAAEVGSVVSKLNSHPDIAIEKKDKVKYMTFLSTSVQDLSKQDQAGRVNLICNQEPTKQNPKDISETVVVDKINEADLYPLLKQYLRIEFDVRGIRINENRSGNIRGKGGNKWLHPDLVGFQVLDIGWDQELRDCVKKYPQDTSKIWSFEVKLGVTLANVREYFFQAVSNSSWANFAYLVATSIDKKALEELRILSSLHGVGLMQLSTQDSRGSQIILPARERALVDWQSVNRLVVENPDFKEFVKRMRMYAQTGDLDDLYWLN